MSDNVLQLEVPALHCDVNLKSTAMQGPALHNLYAASAMRLTFQEGAW